MDLKVAREGSGHRLTGEGPITDIANRFLGHLEARAFSPGTVRGYAYDLLNFSRSPDERDLTLTDATGSRSSREREPVAAR